MGETEFSEFERALSVYFQRGADPSEFTRELFTHIYKGSINGTDTYVHVKLFDRLPANPYYRAFNVI